MEASFGAGAVEKPWHCSTETILAASVGGKEGRGADESEELGFIRWRWEE